jgi:predicted CXXCH cytochrome family protein
MIEKILNYLNFYKCLDCHQYHFNLKPIELYSHTISICRKCLKKYRED